MCISISRCDSSSQFHSKPNSLDLLKWWLWRSNPVSRWAWLVALAVERVVSIFWDTFVLTVSRRMGKKVWRWLFDMMVRHGHDPKIFSYYIGYTQGIVFLYAESYVRAKQLLIKDKPLLIFLGKVVCRRLHDLMSVKCFKLLEFGWPRH